MEHKTDAALELFRRLGPEERVTYLERLRGLQAGGDRPAPAPAPPAKAAGTTV